MKILIELPSWLGDSVMLTPSIENIVKVYQSPDIVLVGPAISVHTLKYHPAVQASYIIKKNYFSLFKLSRKLGNYDAFFSFRSSYRSSIFKFLISSKQKFQFSKRRYKNRHQVQAYSDFLSDSLKVSLEPKKLIIYPKKSNNFIKKKPMLGINPGASYGNAKRWYPEKFAEVASKLSERYEIFILGGFGDKDIASDIEEILIEKDINNINNLAGKTSIEELIILISNLDMLITGDSGPMHIAASFEIPTITIFGPTNDLETSQWMTDKSRIIKKNLSCQPCMKRVCALKHHNCMKLISADDVLNEVRSLQ